MEKRLVKGVHHTLANATGPTLIPITNHNKRLAVYEKILESDPCLRAGGKGYFGGNYMSIKTWIAD